MPRFKTVFFVEVQERTEHKIGSMSTTRVETIEDAIKYAMRMSADFLRHRPASGIVCAIHETCARCFGDGKVRTICKGDKGFKECPSCHGEPFVKTIITEIDAAKEACTP